MERQVSQFFLHKPRGDRGGDPIATALSNIASGIVTGIGRADELKTAALNRELAQAREERAKEEAERKQEEHDQAKQDRDDAKQAEKLAKMKGPDKAPETSNAIAEYLSTQPEFANISPEDIIHTAVAEAEGGETVVSVQNKIEKQRTEAIRAAAAGEGAAASTARAETGEKKRTDVAAGVGGTKESEASIKNRGEAEAQETIGAWEEEVGRDITLDEVKILRDSLEGELSNVTDVVERKVIRAQIAYYNTQMMGSDLGRSAAPSRGISTRGRL